MGAFVSKKLGETRALGTAAGDLKRAARSLERDGYREQAGALMGRAAIEKASQRGFGSAEGSIRKEALDNEQRGLLLNEARNVTLGDGQPQAPAAAPTGSLMGEARTSRLDASPTPGLDAQDLRQTAAPSLAQTATDRARESALSGNLGSRAKIQAQDASEKSVMAEMRASMGGNSAPVTTPAPPAAPSVMLEGRALAQKNIAEKGIQGAAADYFARKDAETSAKQDRVIDSAFSKPVQYQGGQTAAMAPSASAPANVSQANPVRAQAPARPASVFSGVNDIIASSESEDFGGKVAFKERGMGYNKEAVAKVKGATDKVDATMNRAAGAVGDRVKRTVGAAFDAGSRATEVAGSLLRDARAFTERTNKWSANIRNR